MTQTKQPTVVVTGAAGFVGGHLVSYLKRSDFQGMVIPLDRKTINLNDRQAVQNFLHTVKPSTIVHLAASMARREEFSDQQKQWRDTFDAGKILLECAVSAGVSHLLMAGSVDELGQQGGVLTITTPAKPYTTYGLCKSLLRETAEFAVRRAAVRIDWFRPFTIFGPAHRGDMLIPYAFEAASKNKSADFTEGTQQRDFLYIDDLIHWLVMALRVGRDPAKSEGQFCVHHLGSGQGVAVREVLLAIASEFPGAKFNLGSKQRRGYEPAEQIAPPYKSLDVSLQSWEPQVPWREGIAKTAIWWRSLR